MTRGEWLRFVAFGVRWRAVLLRIEFCTLNLFRRMRVLAEKCRIGDVQRSR